MKIFTFWRSLATLRVRIALNLKELHAEEVNVDLLRGDQRSPEYQAINPQMVIPSLIHGAGPPLVQSLAILEYLDETYPQPALMPQDARGRARVRALAMISAADSHPLVVPRVRQYLAKTFGASEEQQMAWARHWIGDGLRAIEAHLADEKETGVYCHGDSITIADISVVSLAVGQQLFGGTLDAYPVLARIFGRCMEQRAFAAAQPLRQPGAPTSC
jgi:maleylacetoacetate isomerase